MDHKVGFLKFGFAAAALVFCSAPAYATLIFSVQSVTASPGSVGNVFDVLLTDTGSPGVSVAGFNFEIEASDPDITFTGVFTSTATAPYIFSGNSIFGPEIDTQTSPTVIASDLSASSTTLNSGDVVGLGQVFFNVSANATGPFTVSFTGGAAGNNLENPSNDNIPIDTFSSGTITIASVPEPSSLLLMLAGIAALVSWNRRRRCA